MVSLALNAIQNACTLRSTGHTLSNTEVAGIVVYEALKALKNIHCHHRKGSYQAVP